MLSKKEEEQLMADLWSADIADNPYNFVMYAYPWGRKGTPLAGKKGPRRWQKELLLRIADGIQRNKDKASIPSFISEVVYEIIRMARVSGRGIGKSCLIAWLSHWMLSTRIGSTVIISANTEEQLKRVTFGEISKWMAMAINGHWFEPTATSVIPCKWLKQKVEEQLCIGTVYWIIDGKTWSEEKPDSFAGPHNEHGMMIVFDEAAGIPDGIWSVAQGYFTENTANRFWLAFSNGRRNSGYFYECFRSKSQFWDVDNIDARSVEDSDKSLYDSIIEEYGEDSDEARVEVYGQFPKSDNESFIGMSEVEEAFKRPSYNDPYAPVIMGVDPARGGDFATIVVIQGRDLKFRKKLKTDDLMELTGEVVNAMERWKPELVNIDEGGLGAGVYDRLKEQGYKNVRSVNFGWSSGDKRRYANFRAEMWGRLKKWLKTASIPVKTPLDSDDKLVRLHLTTPRKKFKSNGATALESKEDIRARKQPSPDYGDAMALCHAFPIKSSYTTEQELKKYTKQANYELPNSWMGA